MVGAVDRRVAMATGALGAVLALWAALGMHWWSSGGEALLGLRLDLTGIEACVMIVCEGRGYGELPAEAFSRDPTVFVLMGRIALGAAALASAAFATACALRLSGKEAPAGVSPERLAILFAGAALAAAVAFVATRPDVAIAPEMEAAAGEGGMGIEQEMAAALLPDLGLSAGFPTFAVACVLIALGAWLVRASFER